MSPVNQGRRGLLAAVVVTPLVSAAVASPHPDAELIRLCAEFCSLHEVCHALPDDVDLDGDCPEWNRLEAVDGLIRARPATTLDGLVAKATAVYRWALQPDGTLDFSASFTGEWPELIVQDLLRMAGALAPVVVSMPPPHPVGMGEG